MTQEQIRKLVNEDGGKIMGYITTIGYYQVELSTTPDSLAALQSLMDKWIKSNLVEDAYLNTVSEYSPDVAFEASSYPNDYREGADWSEGYPNGNNWGFEAIYAASAQEMFIDHYGSLSDVPFVKIGVMDSCFDPNHNDLNYCKINYTGFNVPPQDVQKLAAEVPDDKDSDKNNTDKVPPKKELYHNYAHGTHVAGTIAAKYNSKKFRLANGW